MNIIQSGYCEFNSSRRSISVTFLSAADPANYILWNAQLMATQGSMARCRVPDVLSLYEKCMKNMYRRNRCDEVTLSE